MKVDEIRERFLRFFEQRGHKIYPSDSLVPANDPTLLFTSAGMNQFKEEFLGKVKGPRRAVTSQKCLRTGDLERVGKTPGHHTFFEMLGNFSFGDYFKKEAIEWAWEFLTKDLGLDESELWVSVYKDDDEAYGIWKRDIGRASERILKFGEKENFWPSNAPSHGPDGPCGPCSEIFFGGPDGIECWNLVFTQFDRKDGGRLETLPNRNIDTGMGLERIARVMQGKKTNFEIDSFLPIVKAIRDISVRKDAKDAKINAIADHIRAVTFAVADGVLPSNEERGYVIRKLIRKAFWYGRNLGLEKPFLYKIVPAVARVMKKAYPELTGQREDIAQIVLAEEERFKNTIEEGLAKLNEIIAASSGIIAGKDAFKLYDTYGFPLELTQDIAGAEKIKVDLEGFEEYMAKQRAKSKKGSKIEKSIFVTDEVKMKDVLSLKITRFVEDKEEIVTKIAQVDSSSQFVFLEKTNFYGEKGGQVGDTGVLLKDGKVAAEVINAIDVAGRVQHEIRAKGWVPKQGDKVVAKVDIRRRDSIKKNHTATHLLHHALRKVLGLHVRQAGSFVAPERLRFDFTHFKALTDDEISRIEELINENIKKNSPVYIRELAISEARKQGAIALFGERYGDIVRMVSIGDYSKELCGGTHVKETLDIGRFKIISESSIASGVRRIEAVTGDAARKKQKEEATLIKEIAIELETTPDNIINEVEKLSGKLKKMQKEFVLISDRFAVSNTDKLLSNAKEVRGYNIIVAEIKNADMDLLRKCADIIKGRLKKAIFVLSSEKDGKFSMVVGTPSGLDAVRILNEIGISFGIKGGGRPDFAQAGAKSGSNIEEILKKAEEVIRREIR